MTPPRVLKFSGLLDIIYCIGKYFLLERWLFCGFLRFAVMKRKIPGFSNIVITMMKHVVFNFSLFQ